MRDSSLRRSTALTTAAIRSASPAPTRSSSVNTARTCGSVTAGVFPPEPHTLRLQEPQGQQRQRHVVFPAHPTAHLVVRQTHFALAFLQPFLDPVTLSVDPSQFAAPRFTGVGQRIPRPRRR